MNKNIEVIADNAGGITVQNTETKAVAYFPDIHAAKDDLKSILDGDDMSGWDTSNPEHYITDEMYAEHESSGGYRAWDAEKIEEEIAA
jgi:hypothetical protein